MIALLNEIYYELWDWQTPVIPERSLLFHLEPIGVGTPDVESLTSYFKRLALAHSVSLSKLIKYEIAPLIGQKKQLTNSSNYRQEILLGKNSKSLNGTGKLATVLVEVLESITRRNDLRFLTMLPWGNVLPILDLLRPVRAWCPACYEEQKLTQKVVYEPLIWTLSAVRVCPLHHQRLETRCPHCYCSPSLLAWHSLPGYCSLCRGWLGRELHTEVSEDEVISEDELQWQIWVINNIGKLLVTAPRLLSSPSRERVRENIITCVHQVASGSELAFAASLGKWVGMIQGWRSGKRQPTLNSLLQVCYRLNLSLVEFLTQKIETIDLSRDSLSYQVQLHKTRKPRQQIDLEKVQAILQASLDEFPPPTLVVVTRRLETSSGNLYKYFPDLCYAISARSADYQKAESCQKMQRGLEDALRSDALPPPSLKQVATCIGYSSVSLRRNFPDLCLAITTRRKNYRKSVAQDKEKQIYQEVRQAALITHDKGMTPNGLNVGRLLKKPGTMRHPKAIAALRDVRRSLGYEK